MQPLITIFCPFTRYWAVEQWLSDLESVKLDYSRTSLAIIVDIDDPRIWREVKAFAEEKGFRKFVCKMNTDWEPNEVNISTRRLRIADVKNQSKQLIAQCDGQYVLGLEDDTVFTGMSLHRLIEPLRNSVKIGFVEGVQCGRWGVKMIGAWQVDDVTNPEEATTLLMPDDTRRPYTSIAGGGWYGYATPKSLYLEHDYYASAGQPWGPDVNYGLWLRNKGYDCLVDWQTIFGHNDHNRFIYPDGDVTKIIFKRNHTNGSWDRTDIQQGANHLS